MITYKDIDTAVFSTRMVIYGYLTELLNKSVDKCFIFNENALYISQNIDSKQEFEVSEMSVDELLILTSMVKDTELIKSYVVDMSNVVIDIETEIVD